MLQVRVGRVHFEGQNVNRSQFLIEPGGFKGWDDGVEVRRDELARPAAHGAFDVPGYLSARVVSISGQILAASPQEFRHMRRQLTGLLADGRRTRMAVVDGGETLWADIRLAAQTVTAVNSDDLTSGPFQVQLWAADPRRYGDARVFAGGAPAFHMGNFPAAPVHTVSGTNATGYTITGPDGRKFKVVKAVAASKPHTIDMATGFLTVDGVVVDGAVTIGDTWAIPGGGRVAQTVTGAGLSLSTQVLDTFV